MIGWIDAYKVVEAMTPLYVALMLGYGSAKWWHIFTQEHSEAINRLVCYFTLPFLTFQFTSNADPFSMNYRFIGADVISKCFMVLVIGFWLKYSSKGSYSWALSTYSLCVFSNVLIVGVPLLNAVYGQTGVDIAVQETVMICIVWQLILLFALEIRRTVASNVVGDSSVISDAKSGNDLEGAQKVVESTTRLSFWFIMKVVLLKLVKNPNLYGCVIGIVWAFPSKRWHLKMPTIIEGSILIMSKAGIGTAMFSMGLFMALQKKVIACGVGPAVFAMVVRFIAAPAAMAISALAIGLRGDVLRIAIIQAAMPQGVSSFIFAKEYGFHAEIFSTAVLFGAIISLPILIAYFAVLELLH